ncbi:transducin family protein / WD-40 repeat family protein [Galdieria sulphuraria]|uniref:Transducin family protein / WD-40 repeat family protein n=1 Tax=Galdieria sulphuraria TaxID=130081 RepID=M2W8F5_GALSU|nr:transducin family protein / WD-40 repeat family protein [Galdieria sulphuraria]EME32161.1 transducin family protein / WD-40 repeat family protein [Galdieria sulphuraria]|eukprot:XP_005708681.1 transducin family protein / WD-40 repeat family protein [Galdieria sulphuraria]
MSRFNFHFRNLCGSPYQGGDVIFSRDGNSIFSPVGNRVNEVDLVNGRCRTFDLQARVNIIRLCISPKEDLLLAIGETGQTLLFNLARGVVIHRFNISGGALKAGKKGSKYSFVKKPNIACATFSPDGSYFAVAVGKEVQIWQVPQRPYPEYSAFMLVRKYTGFREEVTCIDWSPNGMFIAAGSKDLSVRIFSFPQMEGFLPVSLTGSKEKIVSVRFSADSRRLMIFGRDGLLLNWFLSYDAKEDSSFKQLDWNGTVQPKLLSKHSLKQVNLRKIVCATTQRDTGMIAVGYSSGVFALFSGVPEPESVSQMETGIYEKKKVEFSELEMLQSLSCSSSSLTCISINPSGEWLALGSSESGSLIVWEWQSETHVLKQQGHSLDLSCLAFSPDGRLVVTGGDDAKVKVWHTSSGFCNVSFNDHEAAITGITFAGNKSDVVISSSLDGTVRAFDLKRYRCFRVLVAGSDRRQFSCVAVDIWGDLVAAGSQDNFEVYLWSLRTGDVLEVLTGHEGPVSSLAFSPTKGILASVSWDATMHLWDIYSRGGTGKRSGDSLESLKLSKDAVSVAFRPDGKELAVSCIDGQIWFWDMDSAQVIGTIEGRRDASYGRSTTSLTRAGTENFFSCICYSPDGKFLLAGSDTKYCCVYYTPSLSLLKRFSICENRSIDGTLDKLNSRYLSEEGNPLSLIEDWDSEDDEYFRRRRLDEEYLPGQSLMTSKRKKVFRIRTREVKFSPTGAMFAVVTTEGLILFSSEDSFVFDPVDLQMDATPENALYLYENKAYSSAIIIGLRLDNQTLLETLLSGIAVDDIPDIIVQIPSKYFCRLLAFLISRLDTDVHLVDNLFWIRNLLHVHLREALKQNASEVLNLLKNARLRILRYKDTLLKITTENTHVLEYLIAMKSLNTL